MFGAALGQLSFAWSMATGRRVNCGALDRMIDGALAGWHEFGSLGDDAAEMLAGPSLDEPTRRQLQTRRFRAQAARGADETAYYARVFRDLGLDPARLSWDDIHRVPRTPKQAVKDDPAAFVRRDARPAFRTTTTGTTGRPTTVYFSDYEIALTVAFNALGFLNVGTITPEDVVVVATSSRAMLGNQCFSRACQRIGAVWFQAGLVDPAASLGLLSEPHLVPGHKSRPSFINTYSSYLGMLVEAGLAAGMGPGDFGLETISVGGEPVTEGLKARARRLFGEGVRYDEGFGMTEIWPLGGTRCEQGHLHWEPSYGLIEVWALDEDRPAAPGELGTLVGTPFAPYRDASVVLRFDSQDVVHAIGGDLTCSRRHLPATSDVHGKLRHCVRHEGGWTAPRDVMEALESVDAVPLPARFSLRRAPAGAGGVAVQVLARGDQVTARRAIGEALEVRGVPVVALEIVDDPGRLVDPFPLRGDLREATFS